MFLFLVFMPLCLFLLSHYVIIKPLRLNKSLQAVLYVIYFVCFFKNLLIKIIGGDLLSPNLPGEVVIFFSGANVWAVVSLVLALVVVIVIKLISLTFKVQLRVLRTILLIFVLLSSLFISAYSVYNAFLPPIVKNYSFEDRRLNGIDKPYRIVQLSDMHICSSVDVDMVKKFVDLTNTQNPDLILITGDLIDGDYEKIKEQISQLKNLKSKDGIFYVYGNHEYYSKIYNWDKVWKDLGFVLLENDNKRIKINDNNSIVIAGISDPQALKTKIKPEEKEKILALDNYKMLTDIDTYHGVDLEKALNGINLDNELVVMMSHKPAEFEGVSKYNVFLTLSGHAHGGMLPILKTIVSWFNNSYVSGIYKKGTEEQTRNLIVSNGTYLWSGFFARINTPGEVVVIDIKGK